MKVYVVCDLLQEQRRHQEQLKLQLEAELKQQQLSLKMARQAARQKDHAPKIPPDHRGMSTHKDRVPDASHRKDKDGVTMEQAMLGLEGASGTATEDTSSDSGRRMVLSLDYVAKRWGESLNMKTLTDGHRKVYEHFKTIPVADTSKQMVFLSSNKLYLVFISLCKPECELHC